MKKMIFFLLSFISMVALAAGASASLTWVPPTAYIDGTALPASDIKSYTVTWTRPSTGAVVGSLNVNAPATTVSVPGLACGAFNFTVSVTTTATAVYPTTSSGASNVAAYATGIQCAPNPPTGVTVS